MIFQKATHHGVFLFIPIYEILRIEQMRQFVKYDIIAMQLWFPQIFPHFNRMRLTLKIKSMSCPCSPSRRIRIRKRNMF